MTNVPYDLRYALRALRQRPLFTAIAIVTLALGIGATTTLFAVVNAVLLRPLPYPHPDQIVAITTIDNNGGDHISAAASDILAWQRQARSLTLIAPYTTISAVFIDGHGGDPVQLAGIRAAAELFSVLGVHPLLGRLYRADETAAGNSDVVVLGRGFWQRAFGADSSIVGRVIGLGDRRYTVIGVIGDLGPLAPDVAYVAPLAIQAPTGEYDYFYRVVARLNPGRSVAAATAEMTAIHRGQDASRNQSQRGGSARVVTLHDHLVGSVRTALLLLFGAVVFLLLIACGNVANLMLGVAASRQQEIAVRIALGASRWRLMRQLLLESLLLAGGGAALGMVLPVWALQLFIRLSPRSIAGVTDLHVNGSISLFAIGIGVTTGVLFGILPAWTGSRITALSALAGSGARLTSTVAQHRVRGALVIGEIAIALALLTGAGLLTRSFINVLAVDVGFQPAHLGAAAVYLPHGRYSDSTAQIFLRELRDRVQALPGVQAAALSDVVPTQGFAMTTSLAAFTGGSDSTQIAVGTVGRDFPGVVGLGLLAGRVFRPSDQPGSALAMLLSRSAARLFFPNGPAVGGRVRLPAGIDGSLRTATVVGVVKDMPQQGRDVTPMPQLYLDGDQLGDAGSTVVVRSTQPAGALESMIRHAVATIDPRQPLSSFEMLDDNLAQSVAPRRLNFLLIDVFALVALVLAALGLYGTMAFQVGQRTREMGIRMALGADARSVRMLVFRRGMALAHAGIVLGLLISAAIAQVLASLLYGVGSRDLLTYLGAPVVLLFVAAAACTVPARRATSVDPVVALREG
ncbi:MAG TPA: ABC transporter permease [Gemmatimonadales bacterium]|jgi:putative ABC transport system permease protein